MKRLFFVIAALAMMACATSVSAQGPVHRHGPRGNHTFYSVTDGLGVSFGYVHSAYRLSDWATDEVETSDGLDGFNIGVTKDFSLYDYLLFLQTGLVYTYQNDSRNYSEGIYRIVGDWDEHYLSIPVKIKYEIPVMDNLSVFAMGGPTLVAGVSSSMKYRARIGDVNAAVSYNVFNGKVRTNDGMPEVVNEFLETQFPDSRYRRTDIQFGASAGVRFLGFLEAQIGYDWGVANKYKDETIDDLKMRRQQFYLSIGVRF